MHIIRETWKIAFPAVLVAAIVVGCSKHEDEPPAVVPPTPTKAASPAAGGSVTPKPANQGVKPASKPVLTKPAVPRPTPLSPVEAAREIAALESAYVANPDFGNRVETIYKIADHDSPESITALGRIFQQEKDPDLKTEVLDSLFDIDGQDDRKVAILTAAAGADQPKDVRESAIDALGDIEPKFAVPILQSLTNDSDEEIRDAAKDQIEQLQAEAAQQKP